MTRRTRNGVTEYSIFFTPHNDETESGILTPDMTNEVTREKIYMSANDVRKIT